MTTQAEVERWMQRTFEAQGKAREAESTVARLRERLREATELLRCNLPINGRGECFHCALGDTPDEHGHFDYDGSDGYRPCFNTDRYEDERKFLADAEEAQHG